MKNKCQCSSCRDPEKKARTWKTAESVDDILSSVLDSYLKSQAIDNEGAIDTATVNGTIYGIIAFSANIMYQLFSQQDLITEKEFMESIETKFNESFEMQKLMNSLSISKERYN